MIKKIDIPVIPFSFRLMIFKTRKDMIDGLSHIPFQQEISETHAGYFEYKDKAYLYFNIEEVNEGRVAHECLHLINQAFQYIHYVPRTDNDEIQAYFLQWVVDTVNKHIKKESK